MDEEKDELTFAEQSVEEQAAEAVEDKSDDKSISADLIRGHINTIILRSLYDGDKYGYEIIAEIERKSHGQYSMKQPSLYSALKRLESQGYVTSYWGGSVGGGRRKYFSLTEEGRTISERNQSEWEYSRTVIDSLISEKQFDFNNPAPTAVDMRVLKKSTSRTSDLSEEEALTFSISDEERARFEEERVRSEAALAEERAALEEERNRTREELEERQKAFDEELNAAKEERARLIAELKEREIALEEERARAAEELAEKERAIEQERETLRAAEERQNAQEATFREEQMSFGQRQKALVEQMEQEDANRMEELRRREMELEEQKNIAAERVREYERKLLEREQWIAEENERHRLELEEREKRVREEQAREYALREKQLIHQNYLRLVNTPPTAPEKAEEQFNHYNPPVIEEKSEETPVAEEKKEESYRTVVQKLYSNSLRSEPTTEAKPVKSQSLGQIDFYDLEEKASKDGIRIRTAGGGGANKEAPSDSVVHKGKALFLSALVVFVICLIEGSVLIALQPKWQLPLFYPYFVYAAGVATLLICGLAYANRYGEHALRQAGNTLINCCVTFVLLAIFTLVLALAVKIDFANLSQLATFVIVPVVFFLNIVFFAIAYVLQIKKRK